MAAQPYLATVFGQVFTAGDGPGTPAISAAGYTGAGFAERLMHWRPGTGSADRDTVLDLPEMRGRSRDLVRNTPIGAGAIDTPVTHVVGTGLRLQSRIDARRLRMTPEAASAWQSDVEWRFGAWASSEYADAFGEQNFNELQDLALRTTLESGDAAVVLAGVERPNWPWRLALQIIEADRICNPSLKPDTEQLVAGIERDARGAANAVHISSQHPGGGRSMTGATWTRVPLRGRSGRRNVLLLKRMRRPGQSRGVPLLAPIISTLKQMARYSDAEIDAAVNSAAQALFATMDADAFQEVFQPEAQSKIVERAMGWDGGIQSGRAINLLPGESVTSPTPGRPNPNFDPFMTAFMKLVGVGLNCPTEVLMKHFQSSYSAARAALLDAWRTFNVLRAWFVSRFCQPVYEEWLADEVAAGRVAAPGFFADALVRSAWCSATWAGDGPGALDPLKEALAIRERIDIGLTTLADETSQYDGGDWEMRHAQRAEEVRRRRAEGLELETPPASRQPLQPAAFITTETGA